MLCNQSLQFCYWNALRLVNSCVQFPFQLWKNILFIISVNRLCHLLFLFSCNSQTMQIGLLKGEDLNEPLLSRWAQLSQIFWNSFWLPFCVLNLYPSLTCSTAENTVGSISKKSMCFICFSSLVEKFFKLLQSLLLCHPKVMPLTSCSAQNISQYY